ncbi:hypothetical protein V5F49_05075 [Xanthobacter sp. V3C-3]|uniref:hypothetical protein n=1 Tax=Xanthobacter lutulentifluminis TaxID=3119935 RepID=UPI0037297EA4
MGGEPAQLPFLGVALTAGISALAALAAVFITAALARRREHEADWRKLKLAQYQEYVLALSGVVQGRATPEAQRRYADAVNALALVASVPVLEAHRAFQAEITYMNAGRSETEHDKLLDAMFRAMRKDVQPRSGQDNPTFALGLLGIPPEARHE